MDIDAKLEHAIETCRFYRRMPFPERARLMMRAAEKLSTFSVRHSRETCPRESGERQSSSSRRQVWIPRSQE